MSNTSEASSGGISFCGMLTILFIGLRLGNVIDWSWWWVLAPMWMPLATVIVVVGIVIIAYVVLCIVTGEKP